MTITSTSAISLPTQANFLTAKNATKVKNSDAFDQLISAVGTTTTTTAASAPSSSASTSSDNSISSSSSSGSTAQAFLDYMKKSPMERMEDDWLKAHGLTKEQLAAMPPAEQDAIKKQMAADIKAKMEQDAKTTGKNVDVLA